MSNQHFTRRLEQASMAVEFATARGMLADEGYLDRLAVLQSKRIEDITLSDEGELSKIMNSVVKISKIGNISRLYRDQMIVKIKSSFRHFFSTITSYVSVIGSIFGVESFSTSTTFTSGKIGAAGD